MNQVTQSKADYTKGSHILRDGRVLRDGAAQPETLDILIGGDGRIAEIAADIPPHPNLPSTELHGKLVVPGLVDVHQHLDKALTLRHVDNPQGDLLGAIKAFSKYATEMTGDDIAVRAKRTINTCLAYGTIALRSHANVDADVRNRGVEALVELREQCKETFTLQVVAFLTSGSLRKGADSQVWLEDALKAGADVVGGAPSLADDPETYLDLLFDAADRYGLPIDLHLDEHLNADQNLFSAVVARTKALGYQGKVVLGHCSVLGALPTTESQPIIESLVDAEIGVITLPTANLFLQGRDAEKLAPRGLTKIRELMDAGVPVAAASDNIQDPFVPVGSGDMLEIARWTLLAGHLGSADLSTSFDMVSNIPAAFMGLQDDYGIRVGARADLLVTSAEDPAELVGAGSLDRSVMAGGQFVTGIF